MLGHEGLAESPLAALPETGAAAQSLTASLFTNTQTFFAPTVTGGASTQDLTPDLFTNSQTFYAPTVTGGAVTLLPTLYTNTQTFYAPAVTVGAANLLPDLFTNTNQFFSPTVTGGATVTTPAVGGGISHSKKAKKPEIVVVTVDGQDYRVPVNQLQAFLDGIKEEAKQPEVVSKKIEKKRVKAPEKAYEPPRVVIKSAPPDVMQMIRARVDRSNELIAKIWAGTIARKIREMEIDEEESILLLLAA